MRKPVSISPAIKWTIVITAIAAAAMSLWLTLQKLTGGIDTLAGCGAGSGCSNVLGSKWSMVLGVIPVSVFSFFLYLAVLVSLWMGGVKVRWFRMMAGWMFLAAAVWFTALQVFVLAMICPYCMAMHGLGVLLGGAILWSEFKVQGAAGRLFGSLVVAVVMVAGLAVVQYYGPAPDTHRVDDLAIPGMPGHQDGADAVSPGMGGVPFISGGQLHGFDEVPHMGNSDAEHVIVKYFDYSCEACREAHGYLEKMMAAHPGKLAVVLRSVPLERSCNPHIPVGVIEQQDGCKFAKLSLRVWRADPTKFAEFHDWLFEYHAQPYEVAEAMAYSLVAPEKMESVDQAWVEAMLKGNVADYKILINKTPVMPKILLEGSKVMQGGAKDYEAFEKSIRQILGF